MPDMITLKIGNKIYDIRDIRIGDLADLDTTAKNSLVSAINEVFAGRAPTDQQVQEAVDAWLEAHPEATTTVEDGSITKAKLVAALSSEITQNTEDVADLKSALDTIGEVAQLSSEKINAYFNGWYLTPNGGTSFLVDLQNAKGSIYCVSDGGNRFRWGLFTDAFSTAPSSAKIAQAYTDAGNSNKALLLDYDDYKDYKTLAIHIATPYSDAASLSAAEFQTKEHLQEQIDALQNKTVIISNPFSELYNAKGIENVKTDNGQIPLNTVYANWDALVSAYPSFMTKYRLGTDTTEAYDINCYTISSKNNVSVGNASVDSNSNKHLKILWVSSIHGDEANTTNEDYAFFADLLANHSTKDALGVLWDNVDFLVIPVANPWGYVNLSRFNANGVNLNRNFPVGWELVDKDTDPYNYGGAAPNDQKETQLLVGWFRVNTDAYLAVNRHGTATFTAGNVIGYIWSAFEHDRRTAYGAFRPVDSLLKDNYSWIVGDKASNANHNILTVQDNVVYGGTLDMWFNIALNMHGFLLELGNSAGSDYPNYSAKDYHEMCITTIGNLLSDFARNNGFVWSDVRPQQS